MPLLRLIAEGVGPFDKIDLDLSDGKGNPHLGPHILAGVNGSGKSTVLRAIAWVFDHGERGFPHDEWQHLVAGYKWSVAVAFTRKHTWEASIGQFPPLSKGPRKVLSSTAFNVRWFTPTGAAPPLVAAYSPSRVLRQIPFPLPTRSPVDPWQSSLSFETTVQNESVQSWLVDLYSRRAIAKDRQLPTEEYTQSLDRFNAALRSLYGQDASFDVEIKTTLEPRIRVLGRSLNFSQLPDGVRATVGWIADFMRRQDAITPRQPGILLLDEVDTHLHPLWQRKLLPAIKKALPDTQIIVTSHSPFVISSCRGARVHVLELDEHGKAHNRPPIDSPIGQSVQATLADIFGVNSRFDVQTEADLNEWNDLKKQEAVGHLTKKQSERLIALTLELSERSEELKSIVAAPLTIPQTVVKALAKKRKTG